MNIWNFNKWTIDKTDLINFNTNCSYVHTWIIDNKFYKLEKTKQKKGIRNYTCSVNFDDKALQLIWLTLIFNLADVVLQLSDKLKSNGNNPTATYQLGKTIRIEIVKY